MAGRRRLVSYPLSLALVVATLVALSGGFIAWWNYRSGKANVAELSRTLFDQVARQTAALPATSSAARRQPRGAEPARGSTGGSPRGMDRATLLAVLSANSGFSGSWSDPRAALAVPAAPGGLRTKPQRDRRRQDASDDSTSRPTAVALREPRTTPLAAARRSTSRVKARHRADPPYGFFGASGITCAELVSPPTARCGRSHDRLRPEPASNSAESCGSRARRVAGRCRLHGSRASDRAVVRHPGVHGRALTRAMSRIAVLEPAPPRRRRSEEVRRDGWSPGEGGREHGSGQLTWTASTMRRSPISPAILRAGRDAS